MDRGGMVVVAVVLLACASAPPSDLDNACRIFEEKPDWHRAARATQERWGVPEPTQLALVHQESHFRADARPPRGRFLWVFPGSRPSSAYGYGQVLDPTWRLYQRARGGRRADRDDFGDVSDFIGWYAAQIRARAAILPDDAYRLYLAYHEGPGGYVRGSYQKKPWLVRVARKVEARAALYAGQYQSCRERLATGRGWWPF